LESVESVSTLLADFLRMGATPGGYYAGLSCIKVQLKARKTYQIPWYTYELIVESCDTSHFLTECFAWPIRSTTAPPALRTRCVDHPPSQNNPTVIPKR
jgi:hypothetical protein